MRREFESATARTAVVGLWQLSRSDHAVWRELLAYRPDSAPFVEAEWVIAWSRAFGPREPPGAWDDGLKRKFKANLRNRERRLQALGDVAFAVARPGSEQRAALETFYALEASGWKGERGTAIARRATTRA